MSPQAPGPPGRGQIFEVGAGVSPSIFKGGFENHLLILWPHDKLSYLCEAQPPQFRMEIISHLSFLIRKQDKTKRSIVIKGCPDQEKKKRKENKDAVCRLPHTLA